MAQIKRETFWPKFIFMLLFTNPVKSHLDVANCIHNLSDSIKFSFDCNSDLSDIKIENDVKILELTSSCHNVSFGEFIKKSPWIFVISLEASMSEIEIEDFLNDLKGAERPILVNIHDNDVEMNYQTTEDLQGFKKIDQLLISIIKNEEIFEIIQCTICTRFAQLINPKYLSLLKIYNETFKCGHECFKSILDVPFTFDFKEISTKVLNHLHESFINDTKSIKTKGMRIGHNSYTLEKFLNQTHFRMRLEGLSALAWTQNEFQVFEFLIRADCPFPQNYKASDKKSDKYVQNLKSYVKEVTSFHEAIKVGNYEKVEKFLESHKNLNFIRSVDNKSALQVAFESRQFKIFALLRSHGMMLSNFQEISVHYDQLSKLDKNDKKKIREINKKFVIPAVKVDIIDQLMMQSMIAKSSKNLDHEKIKIELRRAFEALNKVIPDILKVITAAKNFEIIFDFENSIVDEFDPKQTYNAGSAFYYRDYALVAAKYLTSNDKYERNDALGIIAHEISHVVMNILYDNEVNPYVLDDKENFLKMNEIAVHCRQRMNETSSMRILFEEKENNETHGELIARVPDMLLHYANRTKLTYVQTIYKPLFEYYNEKVLKNMQAMHSSMEARVVIQDLNKWFEVVQMIKNLDKNSLFDFNDEEINLRSSQVQVFITNHTKSLLRKIYVKSMNSKELTVFLKSSFVTHEHFREALYEIDKVRADVLLVIYCDDKIELLKKFKNMFDVLAIERIIFVVKDENFLKFDFGRKVNKLYL